MDLGRHTHQFQSMSILHMLVINLWVGSHFERLINKNNRILLSPGKKHAERQTVMFVQVYLPVVCNYLKYEVDGSSLEHRFSENNRILHSTQTVKLLNKCKLLLIIKMVK